MTGQSQTRPRRRVNMMLSEPIPIRQAAIAPTGQAWRQNESIATISQPEGWQD
ncbi:hypothetical protein MMC07_009718, partial [Pseudocyphellaria aurata]|nr:hypothetical protein [Pseudocyphellaria aurata]